MSRDLEELRNALIASWSALLEELLGKPSRRTARQWRWNRRGSLSAVMWEMHVWSRLLEDFGGTQGQGIVHWLAEIMRTALTASSTEATQFVRQFGGRVLLPTENDLIALFTASSG